ncbi:MAG TPA: spore coat protein U domain-containing protein [Azospirillaceae bacterium]|nr:spore coat protein U domain-containing protein [Azospirillaceae bacterium]
MDLKRRPGRRESERRTAPAWRAAPGLFSLVLLIALPLTAAAQSGGSSASLTLRGTVPAVCTVDLGATSATVDLVKGQSAQPVATVEERCNAGGGYTVSVASRNGGELRPDGTAQGVPYSVAYDDAAAQRAGGLRAERAASGAPRRGVLSVSVPASPTLAAGDYADVLTVTIAAK